MSSQPVTVHLPEDVQAAIEEIGRRSGRDVASVTSELLAEAVRMRQFPGIEFTDSYAGRVARLSGTGLEIWEIAATYQDVGEDWPRLKDSYPWLTEHQLQTAVEYARAHPREIAERLAREEHWTPERVWATYPFSKPQRP